MELLSDALTDKCSISSDAGKGLALMIACKFVRQNIELSDGTVSGDRVYRVFEWHCLRWWSLKLSDITVSSGGVDV